MLLRDFLRTVFGPAHLGIAPRSLANYDYAARSYSSWLGRPATLGDLATVPLRQWLAARAEVRAAATVNTEAKHLEALWRCAVAEGLVPGPAAKLPRMACELQEPEAWTAEEFSRLVQVAAAQPGLVARVPAAAWWCSLLLVLYDTGERISAVLQVRMADCALDRGGLLVRRRKTHRARWYALAEDTLRWLRLAAGERELAWPVPWTRNWLDERLRRLCCDAGLACGRRRGGLWHKIRRTSGSLVEAAGGDGSAHLGNSRAIFERHYRDPRLCGTSTVSLLPRPTIPDRPPLRVVS